MFSLQRLLGKEDLFFGLLEASAQEAHNSVQMLVKISNTLDQPTALDVFTAARKKDKQITRQINEAVFTTFVTALEREDIERLASALYKIPKTVEKFCERAFMAPQYVKGVDFSTQMGLLSQGTETVLAMVKSLHQGVNLDETKALTDRLQQIENDADRAITSLYRELYRSSQQDAVKVIVLKDLYELLEKVIDRCRDAGHVVSEVVLKNS